MPTTSNVTPEIFAELSYAYGSRLLAFEPEHGVIYEAGEPEEYPIELRFGFRKRSHQSGWFYRPVGSQESADSIVQDIKNFLQWQPCRQFQLLCFGQVDGQLSALKLHVPGECQFLCTDCCKHDTDAWIELSSEDH